MRPIAPRTGAEEHMTGSDSEHYKPFVVCFYPTDDPDLTAVLTRWTLSAEERQRVADGEDIYVHQLIPKGGNSLPMGVWCGVPYSIIVTE